MSDRVDKLVTELTQDTAETLVGTNRFVMYDSNEGRTASLEDIREYIAENTTLIATDDGNGVITLTFS